MITISTCGIVMDSPTTGRNNVGEYYLFNIVVSESVSDTETKDQIFHCRSKNPKVKKYVRGTAVYVAGRLLLGESVNKEGRLVPCYNIRVSDIQVFE